MPAAPKVPIQPGDVVAGKYCVERVLGVGGMGVVVAARHTTLDQSVAIKFLFGQGGPADQEEAQTRFMREARAAARIPSDNVCRVFDVGVHVNGMPFMVMECLEGSDLDAEISEAGPMQVTEAVDCILQAIDGVSAAHDLGIIHRDLKPSNLFLTLRPDGSRRVKVLDFGISKERDLDAHITDARGIIGTPAYMSPEQIKNARKADLRTDVWSLGAILYEVLSGEPPFPGEAVGEVLDAVLKGDVVPLASRRPDVPPEIAAAVHRCLQQDQSARFADTRALAMTLAPFAGPSTLATLPNAMPGGISGSIPAARTSGHFPAQRSGVHSPSAETMVGWTQMRRGERSSARIVGVVAAVAIAIAGGLFAAYKFQPQSTAASHASELAPPPHPANATVDELAPSAVASISPSAAQAAIQPPPAQTQPPAPQTTPVAAPPRPAARGAGPATHTKSNPLLDTRN